MVLGTCLLTNLSGHRKGGEIGGQLRELGASLDWDRQCFTMDEVSVPGRPGGGGWGRVGSRVGVRALNGRRAEKDCWVWTLRHPRAPRWL